MTRGRLGVTGRKDMRWRFFAAQNDKGAARKDKRAARGDKVEGYALEILRLRLRMTKGRLAVTRWKDMRWRFFACGSE